MKAWDERHEAAKEESGYNRADALAESAHSRIKAATEAMASTRATTIEGIHCKARASAKIDEWASIESKLAVSIMEDLVSLTS